MSPAERTAERVTDTTNHEMSSGVRNSRGWESWLAGGVGLLIFALSAGAVVLHGVTDQPGDVWLLDFAVYWDGAVNLMAGRDLYSSFTGAPQFLLFTYPPFAAVLLIPFSWVPFEVAGWIWTILQLVLLLICVRIAFGPLYQRCGRWSLMVWGVIGALMVHLEPVREGLRLGQMNAVIVSLCLVDVARRLNADGTVRARWWLPGSGVALATAIKLTPGVFWLHDAVCRQWRRLLTSVAVMVTATGTVWVLAPQASYEYWRVALRDSQRLGPNNDRANQSLRGAVLRLGEQWPAGIQTLVWVVLVLLVLIGGLWLSSKLAAAGKPVAVVAVLGMVAVLISPVSWVHHWFWGVVAVGALIGDGRRRTQWVWALGIGFWLCFRTHLWSPWSGSWGHVYTLIAQQSYAILAVLTLVGLWWVHRGELTGVRSWGRGVRAGGDGRVEPSAGVGEPPVAVRG